MRGTGGQIRASLEKGACWRKSSAQGAGEGVGGHPRRREEQGQGAEVGQCCLVWKQSPHPGGLTLTFCIQHLRDVQVLLSHFKGSVQVANGVVPRWCEGEVKGHLGQRLRSGWDWGSLPCAVGVVNEVGAVSVDESTGASPSFQLDRERGGQAWVQAGALPYPGPRALLSGWPHL